MMATYHRTMVAAGILSLLAVAAAVSGRAAPQTVDESTRQCLDRLYARGFEPDDQEFDRTFDRPILGGSFACDIFTTASSARRAIDDLRAGMLSRSPESLQRVVDFPFTVYFHKTRSATDRGEAVKVKSAKEFFERVVPRLTPQQLSVMNCASTNTASIMKGNTYGFHSGPGVLLIPLLLPPLRPSVIKAIRMDFFPFTDAQADAECAQ